VKELATRIERKGELDPVLVVKLRGQWVVVDGHHRLAAYRKAGWNGKLIRCEWFSGTAREAMDASVSRNEKTHLRIDQADKAEAAWMRTLLDWDGKNWSTSKKDVVHLTGCGEGTVAQMRRVFKWHYRQKTGSEETLIGEKLLKALGTELGAHAWNKVKEVVNDITPKQHDIDAAAAKLAKNRVTRMTTKLSDDPQVTARALWLYDPKLCPQLVEALQAHIKEQETEEQRLADEAAYEDLHASQ
jgi:hypothetical protein